MDSRTPKSLLALRVVVGYLLIGATGLNLWLSWLAHRTTSTPVGLGILFLVISVGALAGGAGLLLLESSRLKDTHQHTPAQGTALTAVAVTAAASVVASVAVTHLHVITDASRGFFSAAADYPLATALWCVALLSLAAWVTLMAVMARRPAAMGSR